jgi:hypothetical protein
MILLVLFFTSTSISASIGVISLQPVHSPLRSTATVGPSHRHHHYLHLLRRRDQHHWHHNAVGENLNNIGELDDSYYDNADVDDYNDEEEDDPGLVSDAEALLACWVYLQRRKRLGKWMGEEERKSQASLSKGFFLWDDVYDDLLRSESTTNGEDADSSNNNKDPSRAVDVLEQRNEMRSAAQPQSEFSIFENTERDQRGVEFTSFPSGPSARWVVRSKAIKKCWDDPAFREHWYERRWGERKRSQDPLTRQTIRQQKAENRARALPADFLGSEELASMTEEEIAFAIRERVRSNRKRVVNINKTKRDQRKAVEQSDPMLKFNEDIISGQNMDVGFVGTNQPADRPLIEMNESDLRAWQRKRSEVAKRIYSTRLKNDEDNILSKEEEKQAEVSRRLKQRPPRFPPKDVSPRDAKLRIEHALDLGDAPVVEDVQLLLDAKVKGRRTILQSIIRDIFGLRGKCIPQEDGELGFLTHSTIENLGRFVVNTLQSSGSGEQNEGM